MFKIEKTLRAEDFAQIYSSVGWELPPIDQIQTALSNSSFNVCVKYNGKPVGMGRAIGDGLSYFIKDVAVVPEFQGRGVGRIIMESIFASIRETTPEGYKVCVELISAEGKERFYEKFKLGKKPGNGMGHGMMGLVIGSGQA